jgi:hypothetical protein
MKGGFTIRTLWLHIKNGSEGLGGTGIMMKRAWVKVSWGSYLTNKTPAMKNIAGV